MSVVLDKVTEIQDQVIDYLGSVKEPGHHMPFSASWSGKIQAGSSCGELICFADKLATPAEVVDAEFDFVGRLLDTNKEIAVAVVKAASPLTNKILDRKTVKAAAKKVAPKAAAKAA